MSKSFTEWWEESGTRWADAVAENDGVLWTDDLDERRELFDRRHRRPAPPQHIKPIKSIHDYQRNDDVRISSESSCPSADTLAA